MTLTTAAKDYIASNLGRNNCFASSGVSYTDPNGVGGAGSTYNVVQTMKLGGKGPHGEWWDDIPDYRQIDNADITWVGNNSWCVGDGGGGATGCITGTRRCDGNYAEVCVGGAWKRTYCPDGCSGGLCNIVSGGQVCTPGATRCNRGNIETCNSTGSAWNVSTYCSDVCTLVGGVPTCTAAAGGGGGGDSGTTDTGPLEVTIKSGTDCGTGAPSVRLDTSEAFAYFKATPVTYVGVMDIYVQNNSGDCYAYFAWEMRMWAGKPGTRCPTTSPALTEISRFLGEVQDTKTISTKMLGAGENAMIGGSFEIPSHYEGVYTICLTLWGNYSKQALLDELAAEGYPEDIVW